jgi:predicted RNA-binding protein with PUA-like domain
MPGYWILKTEPSTYSFDQLERERRAVWDGVKNPVALKHLRAMSVGDPVLIYHTGDEKAVVGRATVTRAAYPDPKAKDERLVVVQLEAAGRLARPVPLAAIRADKVFADMALVRMPRLSVVPATPAQWKRLLELAGP